MSSSDANESLEILTQALLVIFDSFGEEYIQTDVQLDRLMHIIGDLGKIDFSSVPMRPIPTNVKDAMDTVKAMLIDNPKATISNAKGTQYFGFAMKMSRPFPQGIVERTIQVSVENLIKAIQNNQPTFIFRDILMDSNIPMDISNPQTDQIVSTLATLQHDSSDLHLSWRTLPMSDLIKYLQGLIMPSASAVDVAPVSGMKRKRQDAVQALANVTRDEMIRVPWNVLITNPYPAQTFVSIVLNDEKPIREGDDDMEIISQKIKMLHKHNPQLAVQAYKQIVVHYMFAEHGKLAVFEMLDSDKSWQALLVMSEDMLTSMDSQNKSKNDLYYIEVLLNGQPARAIVDTGAQTSAMSAVLAKKLGIYDKIDLSVCRIVLGVGTSLDLGQVRNLTLQVGSVKVPYSVSIHSSATFDWLIGQDLIDTFRCILNFDNHTFTLMTPDGFSSSVPLMKMQGSLFQASTDYIRQQLRDLGIVQEELLDQLIDLMRHEGIYEPKQLIRRLFELNGLPVPPQFAID